jgi:hypothetical protein
MLAVTRALSLERHKFYMPEASSSSQSSMASARIICVTHGARANAEHSIELQSCFVTPGRTLRSLEFEIVTSSLFA